MNWDDYRYFLAVARTGRLSMAGRQLGVDHATVGRRIKALEVSLGANLFDRSPQGYRLTDAGRTVFAVGKIGDIFAHRGISDLRKASGNMAMFDAALTAMDEAGDGDFIFANFVDFDSEYGHRRDVPGYAAALEAFDARLPEAFAKLRAGDMLILTADHGNDPTWRGTDHTRERIPVIGTGPGFRPAAAGLRSTFADIGETIAEHLGIAPGAHGTSFHCAIRPDA